MFRLLQTWLVSILTLLQSARSFCLAADDNEDGGCDEGESHPDTNESSENWSDTEWLGDETGVNMDSALCVLRGECEE